MLAPASDAPDAARATLRFFSYFTILSNLLVALACGMPLLRSGRAAAYFAQPRVRGAIALYISVTAGVYITILDGMWSPQGAEWLANALLHYWVPGLYVLLWLWQAYAPRPRLLWTDALRWLSFPAAYLAWTLVRGAWLHEYPYPFVDVSALGVGGVLRNALALLVLFVLLGLVLVAVDKLAGRRVFSRNS